MQGTCKGIYRGHCHLSQIGRWPAEVLVRATDFSKKILFGYSRKNNCRNVLTVFRMGLIARKGKSLHTPAARAVEHDRQGCLSCYRAQGRQLDSLRTPPSLSILRFSGATASCLSSPL